MAVRSQLGFRDDEVEQAGRITAFVATWKEHNQKGGGFSLPLGSYGVVWAGNGSEGAFWGGGFSANPEPLIGFGIWRLLAAFPRPITITAHVHKTFLEFVVHARRAAERQGGRYPGHVKEFHGFVPISEAAYAVDEGRLFLEPQDKLGKFNTRTTRLEALGLATGPAKDAIIAHRQGAPLAIPSCSIVVEG